MEVEHCLNLHLHLPMIQNGRRNMNKDLQPTQLAGLQNEMEAAHYNIHFT